MAVSRNGHGSPAWEVWPGITQERSISIERSGLIRVSPATDHALERPAAVQLLYSTEPRMIGIRATPKESDGAIVIKRKNGTLGFQFMARAFLGYHTIDYSTTRRWAAKEVNGVYAIDLDSKPLASRQTRKTA